MPRRKTVVLLATLDTKAEEALYLKQAIEERGPRVLVVDTGVLGEPGFNADLSRQAVAQAAGAEVSALAASGDRGQAVAAMLAGAVVVARGLHARGDLDGVIALGGGSGTALGSAVMRALPFGVPKVMVSTKASGDVAPYVGTKDIVMFHSVTDIMGLNPLLRRVLASAAAAIAAMVETDVEVEAPRPTIGLTAFGVTTTAAGRCRELLAAAGYEAMVFHANGTGGRALEELVAEGAFAAVLDLTTTELADELCGGKQSAGPRRLEAAANRGLPQVVVPGAMDMVNFGPPETVPARYAERLLYRHNPNTTLMRTTAEENAILGRWVGEKLSRAAGPTALLLPLRGFSEYDREGGVFCDPAADHAFVEAALAAAGERVRIHKLDKHINDPAFAEAAVALLLRLAGEESGIGR